MICRDVCNGMEPLMRGQGQFLLTHGLFSEGRFHLCIQPRRLKLNTLFLHSADYFERQCRELWRDRDDGSAVRFQVIDNGPMRLPSTKFHIVLIQGGLLDQQWDNASLYHFATPLQASGPDFFPRGSSVSGFFRTAQVEGACSNLARSCFIKFHDGRQIRTYVNDGQNGGASEQIC